MWCDVNDNEINDNYGNYDVNDDCNDNGDYDNDDDQKMYVQITIHI